MRYICLLGSLLSFYSVLIDPVNAKPCPRIWFTPLTWNITPQHRLAYTGYDFPALLKPNAPWQKALSRISVLRLPANVVATYPDLPSLIHFIDEHHLKLGLGFGTMFGGGTCSGVEGFSRDSGFNHEAVELARLWKRAGGKLDYVVMDSPLAFGHYYNKDCHFSIAEIARRSGATMRALLTYFPNAIVVDAEGPGRVSDDIWLRDMAAWLPAFRMQSGHTIDSIMLDLHWHDLRPGDSWQNTTRRSVAYFGHLGLQIGLIVDADGGPGVTDEDWMAANLTHIHDIAHGDGFGLDYVAVDQWMHHVHHNLPESDPHAYTSLVNVLYEALQWARPPPR